MLRQTAGFLVFCWVAVLVIHSGGCWSSNQDQRQRDEKTREEAAKATEKAKPELQQAGRDLERGAERAAEEAHAAAQGVKEGWERGGKHEATDLNSASEHDLTALPGIDRHLARKIIDGRPYRSTHDLVSRGILSEEEYRRIRDDAAVSH